ncbi:hypothetical protein ACFFRR_008721 [Megaselia abdita]
MDNNSDNMCFLYAVLTGLLYQDSVKRISDSARTDTVEEAAHIKEMEDGFLKNLGVRVEAASRRITGHPLNTKICVNYPNTSIERHAEVNMTGMTYPVTLSSIKIFEKANGIGINVYAYREEPELYVYCIYRSSLDRNERKTTLNLCMITNNNNPSKNTLNTASDIIHKKIEDL